MGMVIDDHEAAAIGAQALHQPVGMAPIDPALAMPGANRALDIRLVEQPTPALPRAICTSTISPTLPGIT